MSHYIGHLFDAQPPGQGSSASMWGYPLGIPVVTPLQQNWTCPQACAPPPPGGLQYQDPCPPVYDCEFYHSSLPISAPPFPPFGDMWGSPSISVGPPLPWFHEPPSVPPPLLFSSPDLSNLLPANNFVIHRGVDIPMFPIGEEGRPLASSGRGSPPVPASSSHVREGGLGPGGLGGDRGGRGLVGERFLPLDPSFQGRSENRASGPFSQEVQPAPADLGGGSHDHSQGVRGSLQIQDQQMAALDSQSTPIAGESIFLTISFPMSYMIIILLFLYLVPEASYVVFCWLLDFLFRV